MAAPRWLARFNKHVTNRVGLLLATRLPGFVIVDHVGRTSRRRYRTPVMAFRRGQGVVIALTYGPQTDWARNVKAAGGVVLETRDGAMAFTQPRLYRDPRRRGLPALVRFALRLLHVADFLSLERVDDRGPATAAAHDER